MEYHAASFIQNSSDDFAIRFYKEAPKSYDTWAETLTFLGYIDEFRYGKLYILEEYQPALTRLSTALKQRTSEALVTYLDVELPGFMVHVENSKIKVFTTDNNDQQHSFTQDILFAVIENARLEFMNTPNTSIQKAIRETTKTRGAIEINSKSLIKYTNQHFTWEKLASIEQQLITKIKKYEAIVSAEIRKHEIFG